MEQFCLEHGCTNHLPNRITPLDSKHLKWQYMQLVAFVRD